MITLCRGCGADKLRVVLDLGQIGSAEYLTSPDARSQKWPLQFGQCLACSLVQLVNAQRQEGVYQTYWYRSGVNEVMKAELKHIVHTASDLVDLKPDDIVVDIGANDGTLLSYYRPGVFKIAYEPAPNLQDELQAVTDQCFGTFFPSHLDAWQGSAKIVTAIACAYAVDDIHGFVQGLKEILHADGVAIVQFQDLKQMVEATAFDNICFEHLLYFTLASFEKICYQHGLALVDAEKRSINGGSIRATLMHRTSATAPSRSVSDLYAWEMRCDYPVALDQFVSKVEERKQQIRSVIQSASAMGKIIDVYGASTKANTLLQVCGLDTALLRWAWERSAEKWHRYMGASGLLIVPEAVGRRDPPDMLLLGIWQFKDAILQREDEYLKNGGSIIVPLPWVEAIHGGNGNGRMGRRG